VEYADIKRAVQEVISDINFAEELYKALKEQKRVSRALKSKRDPDLISLNQAYTLRGKARVKALIAGGFIKVLPSSGGKTSPRYLSRKKLIARDNLHL